MRGEEPAGRVGKHIGFAGVLPSETRYHVHHEEEPASDAKSTSPEKLTEETKMKQVSSCSFEKRGCGLTITMAL